ncbi:formate dehydrogenase accessory sulfurtransferase FdhD [Vibrio lentus]|nr:formate dehydrogenase accessory sulfurtransferase FdhD [Vibrio lentus]
MGRHNALDKLIGSDGCRRDQPRSGFVIMTSRCSLELIHKAVRAGDRNLGLFVGSDLIDSRMNET